MALGHRVVAIYPNGAADPDGTASQYGGNYSASYTTMSLMEAAENGDYHTGGAKDVGSAGDGTVLHVEIIPSDGSWNAAPDTTAVKFDGWKTDFDGDGSFVEIKSYGTARSSSGNWDTVAYIIQKTSTATVTLRLDNDASAGDYLDITFEGVQIEHIDGAADNGSENVVITAAAYHKHVIFSKCFFLQDSSNSDGNFSQADNQAALRLYVVNSIFQYGNRGYHLYNLDASATAKLYNCTISGTDTGFGIDLDDEAGATVKNCASFNNVHASGDLEDFANATLDYNAIDDGDGTPNEVDISPGAVEATEWNKAFVNYLNDWNIKDTNSVLYHAGLDQTSDSDVPSDDIFGTTRPAGASQVSIGAFEYVAAGGLSIPIAFDHLMME